MLKGRRFAGVYTRQYQNHHYKEVMRSLRNLKSENDTDKKNDLSFTISEY